MEEIWALIGIGILVGFIVIFLLSEMDRKHYNLKMENLRKGYSILQNQQQEILNELSLKEPEPTTVKNVAISLIYNLAASKQLFTLKDIELMTKQIQNHYSTNLDSSSTFKMNFPEKELLNFEPKETLNLLTIINEGLHNATLYSKANYIFNIASIEEGNLNLITHDNGLGYNRKEIQDGNGIKTILKAASDLKGDLKLTSTIGNGTVVNVQIPIDNF
ncbi:histidine kinase [Nonlabens mediterrranea]|uniref:Histidine kinase n=1 Tax=Nonlabens mediterrranea TaxID=1419947 RepID=A0ABS0A567_9FLAO|nr:histidine kinase [Nonlabens mediterrranea]